MRKMYRIKIRVTDKSRITAVQDAVVTVEIMAMNAENAQWRAFKLFSEDVQADDDGSGLEFIEVVEI